MGPEPRSLEEKIVAGMKSLGSGFATDELAYYALTSKVEFPIRDRLAFWLHTNLGTAFKVSREWGRVDLAILDVDEYPLALIELKAIYSFDAIDNAAEYVEKTYKDEEKAKRRYGRDNTQIYSLLIASHPHKQLPRSKKNCPEIIKYGSGVNWALKQYRTHEEMLLIAKENIRREMGNRYIIDAGTIVAGSAFSIDVSIAYWLARHG